MRKSILGVLLILMSSFGWTAGEPQTPEEVKQQIEALQKDLTRLNRWMKELKSERSGVESELEDKEQAIQDLVKKLQELQESIKKNEKQLSELRTQQKELQLSIQQQNDQIAAQLRAVYRSGEEESLKLLLNGNNAEETQRLVEYNRYFSNARTSLINGFINEVSELEIVEKSIRSHSAQQAREKASLVTQQQALVAQQQQRKQLLSKINNDLRQGNQRSTQLAKDRKDMQTLLQQLEEALAAADLQIPDQDEPFSTLRGKLVKPLQKVSALPNIGQVNLGGVTLRAQEGEPVKAIYQGRVVFSDWMRGFGFLLILDHGEGYMSLYGYNQSLLKEVGEWVGANDTVATAGSSGGRSDPGLFFAIRHNGTPLKPLSWVRT